MIGVRGFAFLNHANESVDIEPLWKGVIPWIVFIAVLSGLSAIFG